MEGACPPGFEAKPAGTTLETLQLAATEGGVCWGRNPGPPAQLPQPTSKEGIWRLEEGVRIALHAEIVCVLIEFE